MRRYDVIVVGAGTGNMLLNDELRHFRTAIVEPDRFGGTCLNRGCIPSKMFVVPAEIATSARQGRRLGVRSTVDGVDWPAIRERVFGRIDPLHEAAVKHRESQGIDVFTEPARFVGPGELQVGDERIGADRIVVAAGSRPVIPAITGLAAVPYHTSDTIMRIDRLPKSMVVVGGGFIAAEMGFVFSAFGCDVTVVQRGPRLLMAEDDDVSAAFTRHAAGRHRLMLNSEVTRVDRVAGGVAVTVEDANGTRLVEAEQLLLCVGRTPNTDLLDVRAAGLEIDRHGHLKVDETGATTMPGVWALGDAANHFQLKHLANAEARVVRHNLLHPGTPRRLPVLAAPHAVFSEPQVASIGLTEQAAREQGVEYRVSRRDYAETAYGWALEDTTSFVKILASPAGGRLLGAHLIGPHAALLIQPLIQAMMLGQTAQQLANEVLYIHPALTEVVEQALLAL
ncbi:mycothione reductase [Actinoplanes subtropicus]|uniref:mycothione reductase n=1 Tax=Actinoplanes subtropicus TaxID=543632 RepID=UPI0004C2D1FA|nr:mycothione reductase [Actinoplanes subtropicus]